MKIFKAWRRAQKKRDDPVVDLARDILKDRTWPRNQDAAKMQRYLVEQGAIENTLTAFGRSYL